MKTLSRFTIEAGDAPMRFYLTALYFKNGNSLRCAADWRTPGMI